MRNHRERNSARHTGCRLFGLAVFVWILSALVMLPAEARGAGKITIGAVEEVVLLPWGVKVNARIDTGAATSSLDVCGYTVEGKYVNFTLSERCGGHQVRLPLIKMRQVQSTEGAEVRPVVEVEICLGSRRLRAQVTLNDRSRLEFPFLVGRNIIEGNFVVDVSRSKTQSLSCGTGETE